MSSPLLEVKDLQVTVGEEQKVLLDGLNLTIYPGETHVLMGHNGAGKSTLMSALMGDPRYTVTRGQIIFKGQDVTHEPADVRAKLGMFLSFQTPEEIPGITLENFLRTAQNSITGKPVKVFAFRKELAQQMGVDPATFVKTMEDYASYCETGVDEQFGKAAEKLVAPGNGPFYALKGYSAAFATNGGLDINEKFEVLQDDGETVIGGLWACGCDASGVMYSEKKPYVTYGGAAIGFAYTSGRLAGGYAVDYAADVQ